ncbi:secreted RxLR effector protein 161-like [Lactuca sativa]|uniref:secreted RxLR effector protein 161-like n=1 Tax=Lactuca sativa TaxID=4236 RepID=UPI0022AF87CE|nr:secreted RxLR effector protein 161-like [Lactuca sativa]
MAVGTRLTPSLDKPAVDLTLYRSMIGTISLGLSYFLKSGFFIQAFSDVDLVGCSLDRKSTSGGCQLLDGKLVSWQSKKQIYVAISTAEAEYVAVAVCTSQIIWIQVQHSKTKHIALRYHFIKEHVEDGIAEVHFVKTTDQLADIFTKPLDEKPFVRILIGLGMIETSSVPGLISKE